MRRDCHSRSRFCCSLKMSFWLCRLRRSFACMSRSINSFPTSSRSSAETCIPPALCHRCSDSARFKLLKAVWMCGCDLVVGALVSLVEVSAARARIAIMIDITESSVSSHFISIAISMTRSLAFNLGRERIQSLSCAVSLPHQLLASRLQLFSLLLALPLRHLHALTQTLDVSSGQQPWLPRTLMECHSCHIAKSSHHIAKSSHHIAKSSETPKTAQPSVPVLAVVLLLPSALSSPAYAIACQAGATYRSATAAHAPAIARGSAAPLVAPERIGTGSELGLGSRQAFIFDHRNPLQSAVTDTTRKHGRRHRQHSSDSGIRARQGTQTGRDVYHEDHH
eukprot:600337-Rhodomonas_salina.1